MGNKEATRRKRQLERLVAAVNPRVGYPLADMITLPNILKLKLRDGDYAKAYAAFVKDRGPELAYVAMRVYIEPFLFMVCWVHWCQHVKETRGKRG